MLAWWLVVGDQILVMVGLILVPAASTMKTGFGEQCSAQYNYITVLQSYSNLNTKSLTNT